MSLSSPAAVTHASLKNLSKSLILLKVVAVNSVSVDPRIELGVTNSNFYRVWDISLSIKEIPDHWKDWTDAKNWITYADNNKTVYLTNDNF